ncbi:MAG TPA: acyl-CoA dehydrogenase family protein [Egibacteraceae bacterium]|nr:acyl-CoA dehydrogenase family protein [Egibacteraceae bacterium]
MAIERAPEQPIAPEESESFAKSLFLGDLRSELVFPYPSLDRDERTQVRTLIASLRELAAERYDARKIEQQGWIGDDILAEMGDAGLLGLYVPTEYGGQGLSQTAYCRVSEEFGHIDATLAVVMGVHQSIGMKGIHLFGTPSQKERFLPDLASGRKLAGFALTEPNAGSDAYHIESRATPQADGSWVLDGEKRWIGNGNKDVVVTFAGIDPEHGGGHIALILTKGMPGFSSPFRYDTMGLRGNDLRHLTFNRVKVPAENVLGEPGEGFRIAMHILNNGRLSLGAGAVGATKKLLDMSMRHVQERIQFGKPLADFELVEEKISWMVAYLYGLESFAYLATGMVDAGVRDYSLEAAMLKVSATEFIWYAANRCFQLAGGQAYMRDQPYEKILRDIRIFPIFEGANDVLRVFVALSGLKPLADEMRELGRVDLTHPVETVGTVADYVVGRVRREVRPPKLDPVHTALKQLADPVGDQVNALRTAGESLLRKHRRGIADRQGQLKRLSHIAMDISAQVATLSRVTAAFERHGVDACTQERYIAETYCTRAAKRVDGALEQIRHNDDERMHAIARMAYQRGAYGHALYE